MNVTRLFERLFCWRAFFCLGCEKNVIRQAAVKTVTNEISATAEFQVVAVAREQIGATTVYDPAYVGLNYPEEMSQSSVGFLPML